MSLEKRTEDDESIVGKDVWLLTFSDLLMLLLAFFVLRLSMSTFDKGAFHSHFRGVPGAKPADRPSNSDKDLTVNTGGMVPTDDRSSADKMLARLGINPAPGDSATPTSRGTVKFSIDGAFSAESDELTFHGEEVVRAVARSISSSKVGVAVSAPTLAGAPHGDFSSSWELSAGRARAVVRQMLDAGVEEEAISARSEAPRNSVPGPSGATAAGRLELELILPETARESPPPAETGARNNPGAAADPHLSLDL